LGCGTGRSGSAPEGLPCRNRVEPGQELPGGANKLIRRTSRLAQRGKAPAASCLRVRLGGKDLPKRLAEQRCAMEYLAFSEGLMSQDSRYVKSDGWLRARILRISDLNTGTDSGSDSDTDSGRDGRVADGHVICFCWCCSPTLGCSSRCCCWKVDAQLTKLYVPSQR